MKAIIFNGNAKEFDSLYWDIIQGFEQWVNSQYTSKSVNDKVTVYKTNHETVCTRWII